MKNFVLSILLSSAPGFAQDLVHLKSSSEQVNLLELYSSEGCSSCPPKESWFSTLKNNDGLWTRFVPVGFHVDYWNSSSWTDKFSKSEYTERQKRYANEWHNSRIYTPALILNGNEWRNGEVGQLKTLKSDKVGILEVTQTHEGKFKVTFNPEQNKKSWHLYGAILANDLSVVVTGGENEGSTLRHDFVVISSGDTKMKGENFLVSEELSLTIPSSIETGSYAVAFWVSEAGLQKPVQAVGGFLKPNQIKKLKDFKKPEMSQLKDKLTPEQYAVTQNNGTERPFANKYWNNHEDGIYVDIVSGEPLFSSKDKFDSGTGWPSFTKPIDEKNIVKKVDRELLSERTEVRSSLGDSHLGHVFSDGPKDKGGMRYCMNSAALRFIPVSELEKAGYARYLSLFKK